MKNLENDIIYFELPRDKQTLICCGYSNFNNNNAKTVIVDIKYEPGKINKIDSINNTRAMSVCLDQLLNNNCISKLYIRIKYAHGVFALPNDLLETIATFINSYKSSKEVIFVGNNIKELYLFNSTVKILGLKSEEVALHVSLMDQLLLADPLQLKDYGNNYSIGKKIIQKLDLTYLTTIITSLKFINQETLKELLNHYTLITPSKLENVNNLNLNKHPNKVYQLIKQK